MEQTRHQLILAKPLHDGSLAVGIFNLAPYPREIAVNLAELVRKGSQQVFDVWRHKRLSPIDEERSVKVPRLGVHFVQLM
ncbi:hypothetical protein [Novipirellula artificiosorum]|uniref:hypothetical protein n=1 Tax=Novipirellula artificiosorum TaxID=2528016 RepID=UPI0036F2DF11